MHAVQPYTRKKTKNMPVCSYDFLVDLYGGDIWKEIALFDTIVLKFLRLLVRFLTRDLARFLTRFDWREEAPWMQCTVLPGRQHMKEACKKFRKLRVSISYCNMSLIVCLHRMISYPSSIHTVWRRLTHIYGNNLFGDLGGFLWSDFDERLRKFNLKPSRTFITTSKSNRKLPKTTIIEHNKT